MRSGKEGEVGERVYLEEHWGECLIYGMLEWEWQVDDEEDE